MTTGLTLFTVALCVIIATVSPKVDTSKIQPGGAPDTFKDQLSGGDETVFSPIPLPRDKNRPNNQLVNQRTRSQRKRKKRCNERCPRLLWPVCGRNKLGQRKTFQNECLMKHYNCKHKMDFVVKPGKPC
ncbi:uncharacterized protein LOC119648712 [Hermetia illucens]|uniref:uncharacterized protein LOC119648712 n=1 Tax=Hermetia illucens TaxID=343691 RepID=UPI0018CC37A9|nr:uncharacterized protein LOC119648712 [Hermetia illucens]